MRFVKCKWHISIGMLPQNSCTDTKLIQRLYTLCAIATCFSAGAVAPPAWANPKYNPCALRGKSWQMLYWPPDDQCYKIFQIGYPCPPDMELIPATSLTETGEKQITASCTCPPETAQFEENKKCYKLFTIGPCTKGQYFAPEAQLEAQPALMKRGACKALEQCPNKNEIFWPTNTQCYIYLSQGPCPKGQLLTVGPDNIPVCTCNHRYEMRNYWSVGNGCFEHFTKGPCHEKGHLFLPNRSCGCHPLLPHYYNVTQQCYEIGTIGPCNSGEVYQVDANTNSGSCQCKKGHIRYKDGKCYRPFTQGPCMLGFMLANTTTCIQQPCKKGYLYYAANNNCYRIGTKGPCVENNIITFDFETRPSIDGISHNGICGCRQDLTMQKQCNTGVPTCPDKYIQFNNSCFKLYSQEACQTGAWLTAKRVPHTPNLGICECMPGYRKHATNTTICIPPSSAILKRFMSHVQFRK